MLLNQHADLSSPRVLTARHQPPSQSLSQASSQQRKLLQQFPQIKKTCEQAIRGLFSCVKRRYINVTRFRPAVASAHARCGLQMSVPVGVMDQAI